MVAVSSARTENSRDAGRIAAGKALKDLRTGEIPQWALAFVGGRHDPGDCLEGLYAVLGDIPIVGGSAVGTITNDTLSYTGFECSVAVFTQCMPRPTILSVDFCGSGEREAGRRLGLALRKEADDGATVLVFYDSIQSNHPPVLHIGSRFVEGIYDGLSRKQVKLLGAGLIGNHQFSSSFVFDGGRWAKHQAVAIILHSVLQSQSTIMHGCTPVSPFYEITRVDGAVVYELDNLPALDILMELSEQDPATGNLLLDFTLGEKHGDRYAPYRESNYVNRLMIGTDPETRSITLFEADFKQGATVQFMMRDDQLMGDSVRQHSKRLLEDLGRQRPILGLYIDCAGRCKAISGGDTEEASILQETISDAFPLLGFFSGVEIAPLLGRSRPLDWTGVLTILTLSKGT